MRMLNRLLVTVTIVAAASAASAAEQTPAPAAAEGTPIALPAPPAGQSQVVFFRPNAMGMAISCNVRENGKMIGTTNNGRYFVHTTTPGPHTYTARGEKTDEINVETEADETAYVKCKIAMGIMAGRPNLSPSTKAEFDSKSAKLKLSDPEKMAKTIAADDAKQVAAPAK